MKDIGQIEDALETLLGARALLRKRSVHWLNRGPQISGDGWTGDHCAVTAINRAAMARAANPGDPYVEVVTDDDPKNELLNCMILAEANRVHPPPVFKDFYGQWSRPEYDSIPEWNDTVGRTKRQVLGVFTRVAKKLWSALPAKKRAKYEV